MAGRFFVLWGGICHGAAWDGENTRPCGATLFTKEGKERAAHGMGAAR